MRRVRDGAVTDAQDVAERGAGGEAGAMTDSGTAPPLAVRAVAPPHVAVPGAGLGLLWRALDPADAPALHELVAAVEEGDAAPARTSLEEVAELFDGDWKDHARDTLVGVDPDGVMRAWAQVSTAPGDARVVRAFALGGVHPQWRRRGVGAALLGWTEGRARQLLASSGKDLPARIAVYCDDSAHATMALLRSSPFRPARYYTDMRRSLDDPLPDARAVDGVSIVAWTPELDEAVRLAHNEAFADHWGSEPRTAGQWTHNRAMFAPGWSRVAVEDATGDVVGYALSGRYPQDWPVAGYSSGYTDLLGVRRAWRGRGIAVALLTAVMADYRADGMAYAELGVDTANPSGAHGLYAALGYEVIHGSTLWTVEI